MVAASPKAIYMSKPPPMLFGIPILEVELNGDGSVRGISVTRPPANIDARNTIDYAMEAVRRGAPYGDMSRLAKPSTMVSGRMVCPVSANGAPDCKIGADRL